MIWKSEFFHSKEESAKFVSFKLNINYLRNFFTQRMTMTMLFGRGEILYLDEFSNIFSKKSFFLAQIYFHKKVIN